jgi:DNA-directed RNA polymerase subunit F
MSYECIKLSDIDSNKLENIVKELILIGLKEDVDFVLLDVDAGNFLLDFIPEAAEKVRQVLLTESYSTLKEYLK